MNIQSLYASNAGTSAVVAAAAGSAPVAADPIQVDRRGQGHHGHHREGGEHGHGGGRMHHALAQALQGLGLALPQRNAAPALAPAPAPAATEGAAAGAATGSTDAASPAPAPATPADARQTLRADVHDFMHALFQALRDTGTSAPAAAAEAGSAANGTSAATDTGTAPAATPVAPQDDDGDDDGDHGRVDRHDMRDRFSDALSTLISQVGSGNAPAALQSAFDKLVSDLQSFGGGTSQPAPDPAAPKSAPTLQQLLSALQQQTGYGRSAGCGTVGNTINVTA